MTEWYERWFGEEYLRLYPHRNEEDARKAVDLIAAHLPLDRGRVLDLGCGPGRHTAHLSRRGAQVVGLDLSRTLLRRARELGVPAIGFVRGDMRRLPFAVAAFRVVVNLFTSFGYFADDDEHTAVLNEVAAVLGPRGGFVLDYLHSATVRNGLVAREEQTVGSERVVVERRISPDGRFVLKDLHLTAGVFQERVRLFTPEELEGMLSGAGFRVTRRFGAYDGRALTGESPRAIFFAERP
jgi:SAM-dependent methyltransferase